MRYLLFFSSLALIFSCFHGTAAEPEVSREWIVLGVPTKESNVQPFNINNWKKYFSGFNERAAGKRLLPEDRDIFKHYLSQEGHLPVGGLKWFAMFLSDFSSSKYRKDLVEIGRNLLIHSDEDIRALAAEALGGFGDKQSVGHILPLLGAKAEKNRASARRALKQLGYDLPYEEPSPSPSITPG